MKHKNSKKTENSIDLAKELLKKIKQDPELLAKFSELLRDYQESEKYLVPAYVFNKKLTLLESIVKYLKENKRLTYKKIAELINRDQRNIWQVYNSAKRKQGSKFKIKKSEFLIPVSVLSNKKFSVFENIAAYMKEELGLSYHEIARITKRDDRTIWTVYNRYKKKNEK